jgi:hypothetical protein
MDRISFLQERNSLSINKFIENQKTLVELDLQKKTLKKVQME